MISGRRWRIVVAMMLIAVVVAALIFAFVGAGPGVAADLAVIISLAPLAVTVIAWALRDNAASAPEGMIAATVAGGRAADGRRAAQGVAIGAQLGEYPTAYRRGGVEAVVFRSPTAWGTWVWFDTMIGLMIFAFWIIGHGIVYHNPAENASANLAFKIALFIVGCMVLLFGFGGLIMILADVDHPWSRGKRDELFGRRERLTISKVGIEYRWSAQNSFSREWSDVAAVRRKPIGNLRRADSYLEVVLRDNGGRTGHAIELCQLDIPGFPSNQIRAAVAQFAAPQLDRSL